MKGKRLILKKGNHGADAKGIGERVEWEGLKMEKDHTQEGKGGGWVRSARPTVGCHAKKGIRVRSVEIWRIGRREKSDLNVGA